MSSAAQHCQAPADLPVGGSELIWKCRDRVFRFEGRPLIMGILNVTPDSFSDGGRYLDTACAVAHGVDMEAEGVDIVDVGGESTRPGAAAVSVEDELSRVIPVIRGLREKIAVTISVDTSKARVARDAVAAGADVINDVSALTHDASMVDVVRETGAGVVLMHRRGNPRTMQEAPHYQNVVEEVAGYLEQRIKELGEQGVDISTLAVDPGIGFGKTVDHNLELLANLTRLTAVGRPVVVGMSRKSTIGKITGREVGDRLAGSLGGLVLCMLKGAHVLRVHDVRESVDAVRVVDRIRRMEHRAD